MHGTMAGALHVVLLILPALLITGCLCEVHFELGIPDLIATKRSKDGDVTINGYRAVTNEALLATNTTEIAPRLLWATVGEPRIIKSIGTSSGTNMTAKVFHFSSNGFYMMMQLKTDEDSQLLAKRAEIKYGLPVAPNQVRHLLLSKLRCILDLRGSDRRSIRIVGRPRTLRNFPLKVEFSAPSGTEARSLFEKRLAEDPDLSVPCSICLSSSSLEDIPPGGRPANATNITIDAVLPVPGSGSVTEDCRRRQSSPEALAAELTSVTGGLSALACEATRLAETRGSPVLTAAIESARAACARLSPTPNLTELQGRLAAAVGPEMRHRLALRAVYDLRNGRNHNLLDSRRLRTRAMGSVVLVAEGARFQRAGGALVVDDLGSELADLLDASSGWTLFATVTLEPDQLARPLLTTWVPSGRLLWQLSVGSRQLGTVFLSEGRAAGGFASPAALRPGVPHRVAATQASGVIRYTVDGASLIVGEAPASAAAAAAAVSAASAVDLPADRRRIWLGEAPGGVSGVGGFSGVVGCFGAAAAVLTPAEVEAVFAAYCNSA